MIDLLIFILSITGNLNPTQIEDKSMCNRDISHLRLRSKYQYQLCCVKSVTCEVEYMESLLGETK